MKALFLICFLAIPITLRAQQTTQPEPDSAMEARISQAWAEVREHMNLRREGEATEADDPQRTHAETFFEYFRKHPDTPTGLNAAQGAFMMWGNLGAVEKVEEAMDHVPRDSEIWHRILTSIGNAYGRHDKRDEYKSLLLRLEGELTHPRSRSELLLRLAEFQRRDDPERAKPLYEEVVALAAHPFDVQRAEAQLYEMTTLNEGQPAPDFTAEAIDGDSITLSDLRGKVVLLEFWATWCGPCLPDVPHLKALHRDLPASEFQLIGISEDQDLETLERFLEEEGMTWPQIRQLGNFEGGVLRLDEVLELYSVYGIPRSFLIDRDGRIAHKDLRGEALEAAARELVGGAN